MNSLADVKWWMTILIVILNYSTNSLDGCLVQAHFLLSVCSVAKASTKDVECFEPPVKRLLAILCTLQKLLKVRRMLLL